MTIQNTVEFTWVRSEQELLDITRFHLVRASKSQYSSAANRKGRLFLFGFMSIPMAVPVLFFDGNFSTLVSGIFIYALVFYMLVIRRTSDLKLERFAEANAKNLLKTMEQPSLGTHRAQICDGMAEWEWVDQNERLIYPLCSIREIVEREGYLFLCRPDNNMNAIPFHAFGDQQTRRAFIELIEKARNKSTHA